MISLFHFFLVSLHKNINNNIVTNIKYRINVVGDNKSGTLLFCTFKADGKTLARGVFNFDTELFSVISWNKRNLKKKGISKSKAIEILRKELLYQYDWILK